MRLTARIIVLICVLLFFIWLFKNHSFQSNTIHSNLHESYSKEALSDYWKEVANEMEERAKRVEEMCSRVNSGSLGLTGEKESLNLPKTILQPFRRFFWNRERRLVYCPVNKAGSTSWSHNMVKLGGYPEAKITNPSNQVHYLARKLYGFVDLSQGAGEETIKRFNESLKFIIVRHPFERLVSAYHDRMSANASRKRGFRTIEFKRYGPKIIADYRKDKSIKEEEPTWLEFVDFILYGNVVGDWDLWDDHWRPATFSCKPCQIHFDVIAKMETFQRDQEFLIRKMGLENEIHPQWDHSTVAGRNESVLMSQFYFRQLSKEIIAKVYQVYFLDFILFGYNHEAYLEMSNSE